MLVDTLQYYLLARLLILHSVAHLDCLTRTSRFTELGCVTSAHAFSSKAVDMAHVVTAATTGLLTERRLNRLIAENTSRIRSSIHRAKASFNTGFLSRAWACYWIYRARDAAVITRRTVTAASLGTKGDRGWFVAFYDGRGSRRDGDTEKKG